MIQDRWRIITAIELWGNIVFLPPLCLITNGDLDLSVLVYRLSTVCTDDVLYSVCKVDFPHVDNIFYIKLNSGVLP